MSTRTAKYRPRRFNQYVPAMGFHESVVHAGPYEVVFGAPAIAAVANILGTTSIAAAGSTTTFLQDNTDPVVAATATVWPYGPGYGRCLQVVADGAATSTVTVKGRDYLGQPMVETLTLNGVTPVIGAKAFKWIDLVSWAGTAARSITLGTTDKLGLPFVAQGLVLEAKDGVAQAAGSFVTANRTDPQTATTTDPRGTYDPTATLDGTAVITATFILDNKLNSSGNGGLHGLQHFYS